MSLKGAEGWDLYYIGDVTDYWQSVDANSSIVQGAGRCGSAAFRNTGAVGGGPSRGVNTVVSSGYCGWAYYPEAFGVTQTFEVENASGDILGFLRVVANGSVEAWKGPNTTLGTFIGATPAAMVSAGQYNHIGFEWKFDAAAGYFRIYINKAIGEAADYDSGAINSTNIWTAGQWALLHWLPKGYIEDLYWGDTSGTGPDNAFMGDCHVEEQVALTDAVGGGGFYRTWTPSTGSDHGALVNEIPPNDGVTYIAAGLIGLKESFKFPNIVPLTGSIYGVELMPNMVKDVAGGRQVASLLRVSGADWTGATYGVALTTYKYYPECMPKNPAAGNVPWTVAAVNQPAFQAGVVIVG